MKTTSVNVQITKCPKQYEAVRLGMEIQIDPGDVEADVIKAARDLLESQYEAMYQPKPAPQAAAQPAAKKTTDGREVLEFGDKRVQQICNRIENAAGNPEKIAKILEETHKWFAPTEQVEMTLKLAAGLNKN